MVWRGTEFRTAGGGVVAGTPDRDTTSTVTLTLHLDIPPFLPCLENNEQKESKKISYLLEYSPICYWKT